MEPDTPASRPRSKKRAAIIVIALVLIVGGAAAVAIVLRDRNSPKAKVRQARVEAYAITAAFDNFLLGSRRLPMTTNAVQAASPDFVYGTYGTGCPVEILDSESGYQANNAEIVAILMATDTYPNGSPSANTNHVYNPERIRLFNPPLAPDAKSSGLGPDGVFRDPWGNPYIVAVDVDGNYVTESHFKGAEPPPTLPPSSVTGEMLDHSDYFCAQIRVLVWSFGPDGKADPALKVTAGVNADNVYSWR